MKKLFLLSSPLLFITIILLYQNNNLDIRSRAQEDPNFCQNNCKDPTCRSKPDFYDESCCLEIEKTGDPLACPWPQRGWCMPEHCATIPADVNRQRCAAPRQVWCDMCKSNGCFNKPTTPPTTTPKPSTLTPIVPTTKPTIEPTIKPTVEPTMPPDQPIPTSEIIYPTIATFPTAPAGPTLSLNYVPYNPIQFSLPAFSLPKFTLPPFRTSVKQVNDATYKPLGLVEYVFEKVREYDRELENIINNRINKLLFNN